MRTLQIGLIAGERQTSGSDVYYFNLVSALEELGDDVRGLVVGDPTNFVGASPAIASFAPDESSTFRRWTALRSRVRQMRDDAEVIVSHFAPHVFPVLDLVGRRPLVEHFHGPWAQEGAFAAIGRRTVAFRKFQERNVYRHARRIVALSHAYAAILVRDYAVPAAKIRVVPGGVDLTTFAPAWTRDEARAELALPSGAKIIVAARRLESTKGIDVLIEAMLDVRRNVPDVLLLVAGVGSLLERYEARVREAGLETCVRFLGLLKGRDLARAYCAADVSIVPSVAFEGFGLVCLESLACGTPVLVTPLGGLPEAVDALDPSLVLRGIGPEHIASGLSDVLTGTVPLPTHAACTGYAARFGWPEIARRVREVYREVA